MTLKQVVEYLETNDAFIQLTITKNGVSLRGPYVPPMYLTIKELERQIDAER